MNNDKFVPTLDETPIDTAARRLESVSKDFLSWAKNEQYGIMDRAIRNLISDLSIVLFYIKDKERLGHKNAVQEPEGQREK